MFIEASRPLVRASGNARRSRSFSIAVPARKEGDMWSPKPRGFLAEKNTPTTREPRRESVSSENFLLKAQQAEQLRTLRYKMHQHRQHLDELDRFMASPESLKYSAYSAMHQGSQGPSYTFREF
ncbi:hypothetical protein ATEIFO6365_0004041500 [Aspergillus terreus]|uniref:ATPase inhibitor, mitochondrial n=1 Tax=Aspergillus terreus TaxID=33178 RepID=A0A5M3YSS8_ASPTE|nr:hypothetical protein ATETN484_0002044000 [Aspergillus terreus]GFF15296.1 hypothetical protein ATEIFO6365_0004041500 [Aspergillus terreus]